MQELIAKFGAYKQPAIMIAIWIAVFYFVLVLPNKKKQKKQKEMLDSIKEGTEVLTIGGIKGKVAAVNGDYVDIRVDKGVKITFRKSAISTVLE